MKRTIQTSVAIIITLLFLHACKQKQDTDVLVQHLSTTGSDALDPYLTHDNKGNVVLCWTEKDSKDSFYRLKYAIYNDQADSFDQAITVAGSEGISPTAESMGKVAFKSDGTVLAVFGKRFTAEKNPFAGAIYYNLSKDQGKSWSRPQFLHSDTSHVYGRSFFDITNLKNGELGAVWLDGRYKGTIKGSALFFASTEKDGGFAKDSCLAKGTCECCRTDILTDEDGNIHIAYRSITFPFEQMGKQVRDMVYTVSRDNGRTFSPAKAISHDNWAIEGCPHSGPSLSVTKNAVNAVWFTAGGGPGLYYTSLDGKNSAFQNRKLLTSEGRHPQITALPGGKLVMVCEENDEMPHTAPMNMNASKGGMVMKHTPAADAKIMLKMIKDQGEDIAITDGKQPDHHAVLTTMNNGLLVAWIREEKGNSVICYSRIAL